MQRSFPLGVAIGRAAKRASNAQYQGRLRIPERKRSRTGTWAKAGDRRRSYGSNITSELQKIIDDIQHAGVTEAAMAGRKSLSLALAGITYGAKPTAHPSA